MCKAGQSARQSETVTRRSCVYVGVTECRYVQLQLIIGIIVIVSLLERTGTLPEAGEADDIISIINEKLVMMLYVSC